MLFYATDTKRNPRSSSAPPVPEEPTPIVESYINCKKYRGTSLRVSNMLQRPWQLFSQDSFWQNEAFIQDDDMNSPHAPSQASHSNTTPNKMTTLNSPDSLTPSLADTSMGSPDEIIEAEEESEAGFYVVPNPFKEQVTPQRLWFSHDDDASAFTMYNICRFQSSPLASTTDVTYRSEAFSPSSSEATTIAAKNLSAAVSEKNDAFFLNVCLGDVALEEEQLKSPPRFRDSLLRTPTVIIEEPSEHVASCSTALTSTPRQITERFGTFQPHKRKTPDLNPPLSTPREELLFRECILYKQIIQDDTNTILNLKQQLEQLENVMTNKDVDLEDMAVEIRIALDRIDALKREKELMIEQEDVLNETIRILKLEVDRLSPPEAHTLKNDELSNQITTREEDRGSLQSVASLECDAPNVDGEDSHSQLELGALSMKIQDIINRLIMVEAKQQLTEERFLRALDSQRSEIGDSREDSQPTRKSEDFLAISHDQDEVEVVLPGNTNEVHSRTDMSVDCCCMVWTMPLHEVE